MFQIAPGDSFGGLFTNQKRVAFTANLTIPPAPQMPSAKLKRALRAGESPSDSESVYTSSSPPSRVKEEDGVWQPQEKTGHLNNASKG